MARLGRPFFRPAPEKTIKDFVPSKRHISWMKFLNLHGPQSSIYLHEYTAQTHKDYDSTKHALLKLWKGGMVFRPKQQTLTSNSDYHHLVYDLTDKGKKYLQDNGGWVDALRPTGPWVHQFMTSTLTATVHIMCERNGYKFIAGHEILKGKPLHAEIPFIWTNGNTYAKNLTPDSLFAIDYGGSYLAYALEADRNNEANDPDTPHRKSARRNARQYQNFHKKYKEYYGLNCPLVILTVTTSKKHIDNVLDIIQEDIGACTYQAIGHAPDFGDYWKPPKLMSHLFDGGLKRAGKPDFSIKMV